MLWLLLFTFWLALSEHGAISLFPLELLKTSVTVFVAWMVFSAYQLILYETFQDWMRMWFKKNQERRDFSTKKLVFFDFHLNNVKLTFPSLL